MDHTGGVRGGERIGEQRTDARGDLGEDRAALFDLLQERATADQLHHDVRRIVGLLAADVVDPQDVRMLEPGRSARFAMKPPHDFRPAREVGNSTLIANVAAQIAIARAKHRRHAALASSSNSS